MCTLSLADAIRDDEVIGAILIDAYNNATVAGASSEHFIADLLNDLANAGMSIGRFTP